MPATSKVELLPGTFALVPKFHIFMLYRRVVGTPTFAP